MKYLMAAQTTHLVPKTQSCEFGAFLRELKWEITGIPGPLTARAGRPGAHAPPRALRQPWCGLGPKVSAAPPNRTERAAWPRKAPSRGQRRRPRATQLLLVDRDADLGRPHPASVVPVAGKLPRPQLASASVQPLGRPGVVVPVRSLAAGVDG